MHLLIDISAHGLGHLAQTAPVINALKTRFPGLQMTVRSALPRLRLARYIAADFDHVPEARDFGFVMHNSVDIDFAKSGMAYREFHANWHERIAIEFQWLKAHHVDALLSNVAYLPLAGAARASLPSAALCSLNWADLFMHYFAAAPWAETIHDEILSAYRAAGCFLRVTPGLPMANLDRRQNIGPIARLGRRDRQTLTRKLGLAENDRWILLAMGGLDFRLPVENWPRTTGLNWLVPSTWQVRRDDVRTYDDTGLEFPDMLASVDAVITKPGYGSFVEAACNGIPALYMQRDDWPETPYLSAWMTTHARSRKITRGQLVEGQFIEELRQLWQAPAPTPPKLTGIDEAPEILQTVLGLR